MTITIYRSRFDADGWATMPAVTRHDAPELAYDYASERASGSVAPTDDEIRRAVYATYESGDGGTHGRVRVDRIEISR